ncbi:hypothetical protein GQ54DRAFT_114859 [Martensiomyces pterosporus]|nr:hypothetical protein GQ54DRAFT_114859 [Martensiomyces pterosporus]
MPLLWHCHCIILFLLPCLHSCPGCQKKKIIHLREPRQSGGQCCSGEEELSRHHSPSDGGGEGGGTVHRGSQERKASYRLCGPASRWSASHDTTLPFALFHRLLIAAPHRCPSRASIGGQSLLRKIGVRCAIRAFPFKSVQECLLSKSNSAILKQRQGCLHCRRVLIWSCRAFIASIGGAALSPQDALGPGIAAF